MTATAATAVRGNSSGKRQSFWTWVKTIYLVTIITSIALVTLIEFFPLINAQAVTLSRAAPVSAIATGVSLVIILIASGVIIAYRHRFKLQPRLITQERDAAAIHALNSCFHVALGLFLLMTVVEVFAPPPSLFENGTIFWLAPKLREDYFHLGARGYPEFATFYVRMYANFLLITMIATIIVAAAMIYSLVFLSDPIEKFPSLWIGLFLLALSILAYFYLFYEPTEFFGDRVAGRRAVPINKFSVVITAKNCLGLFGIFVLSIIYLVQLLRYAFFKYRTGRVAAGRVRELAGRGMLPPTPASSPFPPSPPPPVSAALPYRARRLGRQKR